MAHFSDPNIPAPQLGQALIKAPTNTMDAFKTALVRKVAGGRAKITLDNAATFDADLEELLVHIEDRLAIGATEAWVSDLGYGPTADKDALKKAIEAVKLPAEPRKDPAGCRSAMAPVFASHAAWDTPDEKWARALAEMCIFTAYTDAELTCLGTQETGEMYRKYDSGILPIVFACQQLSTYGLLFRGFTVAAVGTGLSCSAATISKTSLFEAEPPSIKSKSAARTQPDFATIQKLSAIPLKPGSVVAFNPGGPGETSQSLGPITHIGTVLRQYGSKIQFIDTGVLTGKGEGTGGRGEGGTVDHAFAEDDLPEAKDCVAAGVLKASPGDVAASSDTAMKSRTLGVARLVILSLPAGKKPVVRYISKLVHTKYPISRFVWSLRGLPVSKLRVLWVIYAPKTKGFSEALIKDGPGTPADKIYDSVTSPILYKVNVIRGEDDGSAVIARRKTTNTVSGWVENFESPTSDTLAKQPNPRAEMGQSLGNMTGIPLRLATPGMLGSLCEPTQAPWTKMLGKRYVLKDPDGKEASVEDAAPGDKFMT